MSMLIFYINRAGDNLSKFDRAKLKEPRTNCASYSASVTASDNGR